MTTTPAAAAAALWAARLAGRTLPPLATLECRFQVDGEVAHKAAAAAPVPLDLAALCLPAPACPAAAPGFHVPLASAGELTLRSPRAANPGCPAGP